MGHTPKFIQWMVCTFGFPMVFLYHLVMWNPFFNVSATDATLLENLGNQLLSPLQYMCVGKKAEPTGDPSLPYKITQRFDYTERFIQNSIASGITLPVSITFGSLCKGVAYLSEEVRTRHEKIKESIHSTKTISNLAYYHEIGMDVRPLSQAEKIDPPAHERRPGEEEVMSEAKEALRQIGILLEKHGIPYWVDCGTCLGAYRYGGVIPWDFDIDIGVLGRDHENIWHALQELDREKYQVQDWSSRYNGAPFLKVFVRHSCMLIDIFHYEIDPYNRQIQLIIANDDSLFLSDNWRAHERQYAKPVPFDVMFPVKLADFDGQLVPVPNQTKRFLQGKYGENIDPVRVYSEETGQYEKVLDHPYWKNVNVY